MRAIAHNNLTVTNDNDWDNFPFRKCSYIVVATIGLSLGVLNPQMYSIIVMVAIVTSLMAPPLLRWCLSKVVMSDEEARRLEQEEQGKHL